MKTKHPSGRSDPAKRQRAERYELRAFAGDRSPRLYLRDVHCRAVAALTNYFGLLGSDMLALPKVDESTDEFIGQARHIEECARVVSNDLVAIGLPRQFLDRFGEAIDLVEYLERFGAAPLTGRPRRSRKVA